MLAVGSIIGYQHRPDISLRIVLVASHQRTFYATFLFNGRTMTTVEDPPGIRFTKADLDKEGKVYTATDLQLPFVPRYERWND